MWGEKERQERGAKRGTMRRAMANEKRRLQLLDAARDVFASKGYHDAKVEDICARGKVAKGTFYLYFEDKRSVFTELVDGLFLRLSAAILRVDFQADIESQIRHNMHAVLGVMQDEPALGRILLSYAEGLDPAFVRKIRSFYAEVISMIEAALREGQVMGLIAPGDPRLMARFTIGALKEILLESAEEKPRPRGELVDSLYSILLRGYLQIPPGTASPAGSGDRKVRKGRG